VAGLPGLDDLAMIRIIQANRLLERYPKPFYTHSEIGKPPGCPGKARRSTCTASGSVSAVFHDGGRIHG